MFAVSVGRPDAPLGSEVVVKQFDTHQEALDFGLKLDELLGVGDDEVNEEGVCSLIMEYPF